MVQKVRDIIARLKKRSAENRERVRYDLPRSTCFFLVTFLSYWANGWQAQKTEWIMLCLYTASAVFAAIHDYKEDGELTGTSIFFIVLDLILIGFLCFLFFR